MFDEMNVDDVTSSPPHRSGAIIFRHTESFVEPAQAKLLMT